MLAKKLEQIGLSEKESSVYIALLEFGKATANELSEKSGINRGTTYVILDSLAKKGLVKERHDRAVAYYVATGPENLVNHLENEKLELDSKLKNLKNFLPEIESLNFLSSERTGVKFLQGMSGIEYIRKEFKRNYKNQEILHIHHVNLSHKLFPLKKDEYRKKLENTKMNLKALAIYDPNEKIPYQIHFKGAEFRYISEKKFPIQCEVLIYGNWFSIFDYSDELMGVIINHPSIVKTFKTLFYSMWEMSQQYMHAVDMKK